MSGTDDYIGTRSSSRAPAWDGVRETFVSWMAMFSAFAFLAGFMEAIEKTAEVDLPDRQDYTPNSDVDKAKKQADAVKRNMAAMSHFTMAIGHTPSLLALITRTYLVKYPRGEAWRVVKELNKKFCPDDQSTVVCLRQELNAVKMKKLDNPIKLFNEIDRIRNSYRSLTVTMVSEAELVGVVMTAAPQRYQDAMMLEQAMHNKAVVLSSQGEPYSVEDCEATMTHMWRMAHVQSVDMASEEVALLTCYNCNKEGHISRDCTESGGGGRGHGGRSGGGAGRGHGGSRGGRGSNNNSTIICHKCNKRGHKKVDCWEDDTNASKRPSGWTTSLGHHAAAVVAVTGSTTNADSIILVAFEAPIMETHEDSLMLMALPDTQRFPCTLKLLEDPDIWVGDTGASDNMSGHPHLMVNRREPDAGDCVRQANKSVVVLACIGDVVGTMTDMHGVELQQAVMKDCKGVAGGYNLCSLTKMMLNGWKISNTEDALIMTKEQRKVIFDIKIKTGNGVIFFMDLKQH